MRTIFKIIAILIVIILFVSSIYVMFYYNKEDNNLKDTIPPKIDPITGNTAGTTGKITTIFVSFSDNVNVTEATIYYKSRNAQEWSKESILSGRADIKIPSDSNYDWYYYVTVNDAAGNGPVGDPSTDGSIFYTITVTENVENLVHNVFVEEGTATWCKNCPIAADVLQKKFNASDQPDFYYISMIEDKNTKAHDHLYNDYNIYGYPTVFIDGGYKVISGTTDFEKNFNEKLSEAKNRQTPKLIINLTARWNETRKELTATVIIENKETTTYQGSLRVYVTEIRSRWSNWDGDSYHFAFLDYAIDENVEIQSNKNQTVIKTWDAENAGYSDVSSANLWVVATVFNQKSTKEYSYPQDNKNQFDAYYADATTAIRVTEGSLPPTIGISFPKCGVRYIFEKEGYRILSGEILFSKEKIKTLIARIQYLRGNQEPLNNLYYEAYAKGECPPSCANIFGKITIKTNVQAEAGVEKVEFIIKGRLKEIKETIYEEPYEFTWDTFALGKYTIVVNLYDKEGRTATDCISVNAFINLNGVLSSLGK